MTVQNLCPRCFRQTLRDGICGNCGYRPDAQGRHYFALSHFSLLKDRYVTGEVLGSGGFGITYLAYDSEKGVRCAIKELFPSYASRSGERVAVADSRLEEFRHNTKRFCEEAEILYTMHGTKSVVRVDGFFRQNNTAYMVMEYVDGINLKNICKTAGGNVAFSRARGLFLGLALTLDEIHRKGLLHRDVSPDNIIVMPDESFKLIDFGAARYLSGATEKGLSVVLKPGFAPPEQYSVNGKQGPWTDIYALACTMYYYLTGIKVPVANDRRAGTEYRPLYELRPDISRGFSDILDRALALNYALRYQSVSEMMADVEQAGLLETTHTRMGEPTPAQLLPTPAAPPKRLWFRSALEWLRRYFEPPKPPRPKLFAQFVSGPLSGCLYEFPANGMLVIGRSAQYCNAVISNITDISRLHCSVTYKEELGTLLLEDFSRNGTFLAGGKRLEKDQPLAIGFCEVFYLSTPQNAMQIIEISGEDLVSMNLITGTFDKIGGKNSKPHRNQ